MKIKTARRWLRWHKWTSLVCTLFVLMQCVTGLPLIFHDELDVMLGENEVAVVPPDAKQLSADSLISLGKSLSPGKEPFYFVIDDKPNTVYVDLASTDKDGREDNKSMEYLVLNKYTGKFLGQIPTSGLMYNLKELHEGLFAGVTGKLFLALIAILFVIAIVSGIAIYGVVMKNYDFGMVRKNKSKALKWLDVHNFLGIVLAAWLLVVAFTGIINGSEDVILGIWQQKQTREMLVDYQNLPPLSRKEFYPVDSIIKVAEQHEPGMSVLAVAYPGSNLATPHHYSAFMRGSSPLTSKLVKPVLIDGKTGKFVASREMPLYMKAFYLSEPLHFGNYGGWVLKVIWIIFDIGAIIVLVTGLYLWVRKYKIKLKPKEEAIVDNE